MSSKEQVIAAALKLSEAERLEVAERLYESLDGLGDPASDEAWAKEIERRLKMVDEGKTQLMSWEEARKRIVEGGDGGGGRGIVR
jgi:putative addiction module component (TIGR02574 family)